MGRTVNGDVRTVGTAGADRARSDNSTDSCGGGGYSQEWKATKRQYQETLVQLMLRDDGYLRCIPDGAKKVIYLKWKFTMGPHRGSYVMVVVSPYEIEEGHILLLRKLNGVYDGTFHATVDRAYNEG